MARTFGSGSRDGRGLSRHLVGYTKRDLEGPHRRKRQFLAGCLGRSHLSDDGAAGRQPAVAASRIAASTAPKCGKRLRRRRYRCASFQERYTSATPATDGERVYVSFGSRGLLAFDFAGKLIWQRDLGRIDNYHGAAGSPLLYNNRIILYQDQYSSAFIAAFDKRTGQQLWKTSRQASVGWGTPIAVHVADHDEVIVNGQSRVMAYDPLTGRELWRCAGTSDEVIPTPVVGYGLVFCSSGRVGPTLAIRARRPGRRDQESSRLEHTARLAIRALADPLWRASLHRQRHGQHRHVL